MKLASAFFAFALIVVGFTAPSFADVSSFDVDSVETQECGGKEKRG